MIAMLKGTIVSKKADELVMDVSGVGYQVFCSLRTAAELPAVGGSARLHVVTIVREDAFNLYGFKEEAEKDAFKLLLSVAGVGPKVALAVLSKLTPGQLADAVVSRDLDLIKSVPGVGRKTAERISVDLADKVEPLAEALGPAVPGQGPEVLEDVVAALTNLGYQPRTARSVASSLKEEAEQGAGLEQLIRSALKKVAG